VELAPAAFPEPPVPVLFGPDELASLEEQPMVDPAAKRKPKTQELRHANIVVIS